MHALARRTQRLLPGQAVARLEPLRAQRVEHGVGDGGFVFDEEDGGHGPGRDWAFGIGDSAKRSASAPVAGDRSEEHTSELQYLMRISYAVFCLKKKK